MKKIFVLIISLLILQSLCACGNSGVYSTSEDVGLNFDNSANDFDISVDPYDEPVGATIGFEDSAEDLDISVDTYDEPAGATIGFEPVMEDFIVSFEPYGDVEINPIEFEVPAFDFDFTVEPVKATSAIISFEFADYDFSIDASTFDVAQFAEESVENFSDSDLAELVEMEVQEVIDIAETRANLLADLSHAFKTSGLDVVVNEELGEIMLDSSVLFEVNETEVSAEGKAFLQKFLTVYTTVVFNPKYEGFLSHVLVEGHTDSNGGYDYNLALSQERADNVLAFCLSPESGAGAYAAELEDSLEAIGYSYDRLIYDANGNEDRDASRRVSFRFLIALP